MVKQENRLKKYTEFDINDADKLFFNQETVISFLNSNVALS